MSFSLGRPFTLDASEIAVRRPNASVKPSYGLWRAYLQPTSEQAYPQSLHLGETPDLLGLISEQRIILCDLVEPVARALLVMPLLGYKKKADGVFRRYGNTQISIPALLDMSEKATSAMFNWKEKLPRTLKIPEEPQSNIAPQLLVLQ